ncbi:hypothetical protein [Streptomyces sp. G45]|uniref:hypothetical protein n=1 Tax=Streptomyces sp. G45 TaxID=3406627 RepID=UPI003C2014A1
MELLHQRTPVVATGEVLRAPAVVTHEFVTDATEMVKALSHRSGRVDAETDTLRCGQHLGIHTLPLHVAVAFTGVIDPRPERLSVRDVWGLTVVRRAEEGEVAHIVGATERLWDHMGSFHRRLPADETDRLSKTEIVGDGPDRGSGAALVGVAFPIAHAQLVMVVGVFTIRVSYVQDVGYVLTLRPWISHVVERCADLREVGAEEPQ